MTACELAWAAGLFEGEGCLTMKGRYTFRMEVAMTDRDVVERFARIVGGTVLPLDKRRHNWKMQWRWTLAGDPASELAEQFRPWLGARRLARLDECIAQRAAWIEAATQPRVCQMCGVTFRPEFNRGTRKRLYCTRVCGLNARNLKSKQAWRARRRAEGLPVT